MKTAVDAFTALRARRTVLFFYKFYLFHITLDLFKGIKLRQSSTSDLFDGFDAVSLHPCFQMLYCLGDHIVAVKQNRCSDPAGTGTCHNVFNEIFVVFDPAHANDRKIGALCDTCDGRKTDGTDRRTGITTVCRKIRFAAFYVDFQDAAKSIDPADPLCACFSSSFHDSG